MSTADHKIEKLSERIKRIEEKIDIILKHLNIQMPDNVNSDVPSKPVDIKLRE
jgi:hypothetical protein